MSISPETEHPSRRNVEPLTRESINNLMMPYWNNNTRSPSDINEKFVRFSINTNYKQPHTIDNEGENTSNKFITLNGPLAPYNSNEEHSEVRRQNYWDGVENDDNHILKNISTRQNFSTERINSNQDRVYTGPSLNYYNGNWVVDRFAISNNGRFALIRASPEGSDEKLVFLYDLTENLLIGVRRFGLIARDENIQYGLQNHPELFGFRRQQPQPQVSQQRPINRNLGGKRKSKKNIKKKTKRKNSKKKTKKSKK